MIIRMGLLLALLMANSAVLAATKSSADEATAKKVTHPCARKPVKQLLQKAKPYTEHIDRYAKQYAVEAALVKAVITVESCYNHRARSPKNAQGLMQLIPDTAERFGVKDAYDSQQNVRGGTRYLSWLSERFDGDLSKVLAAYNAGEGRVDKYDGIPPFRETRNYVHDVLHVYHRLHRHQQQVTRTAPAANATAAKADLPPAQATPLTAAQRQQQQALQRRRQQQLAQQRRQQAWQRQQQAAQAAGRRLVIGQPAKPHYQPVEPPAANKPAANSASAAANGIIIGGVSRPIPPPVAAKPPSPATARPAPAARLLPAKAAATGATPRVSRTYASPFKPGRGGLAANKARAPQLYKQ